jgi:hypothetical protein
MPEKMTKAQKKKKFLKKYEECGTVWPACKACGIKSRQTPYNWRDQDEKFAAEFDEVRARVEDNLARDLLKVALGKEKRTSSQVTAAIFTLKALNPNRYAERHQLSGINGMPLEADIDARGKLASALDSLAARAAEA